MRAFIIVVVTALLFATGTSVEVQASPVNLIQPVFSCWFTTYTTENLDGPVVAVSNVVLGYDNGFGHLQVVVPSETMPNIVLPADYNTDAYYVFQAGHVMAAISIPDTLGVLSSGGVIQWIVGNASVSVSQEHLTPQSMCSTLYGSACPVSIPDFCSDGVYCNGPDICNTTLPNQTVGQCVPLGEPVQCVNQSLVCSEQTLSCGVFVPTTAPVEQNTTTTPATPQPTGAPTGAPTEVVPITDSPTAVTSCVVNSDCYALDTFCDGAYRCDTVSSQCERANASYDPCASARETLEAVYNATHNGSVPFPLSVVCVETQGCVLVVLNDENLLGPTQPPSNSDPTNEPGSWDEPVGDENGWPSAPHPPHWPTAPPPDNTNVAIAIGVTAGILIFLGFIALVLALYYEFSLSNSYLNSTALAQASLQASALAARTNASSGYAFNSSSGGGRPTNGVYRPPHNAHTTR